MSAIMMVLFCQCRACGDALGVGCREAGPEQIQATLPNNSLPIGHDRRPCLLLTSLPLAALLPCGKTRQVHAN